MIRLSSRAFYGTSPSFNAPGTAVPFTHTKPKARHNSRYACTRCIQLAQELCLKYHVRNRNLPAAQGPAGAGAHGAYGFIL